jgi:hypothetical protein
MVTELLVKLIDHQVRWHNVSMGTLAKDLLAPGCALPKVVAHYAQSLVRSFLC